MSVDIDEIHSKCTNSTTESNQDEREEKDSEYLTILKTKPRGKKAMIVGKYEAKCQKQID